MSPLEFDLFKTIMLGINEQVLMYAWQKGHADMGLATMCLYDMLASTKEKKACFVFGKICYNTDTTFCRQ